MDFADAMNYVNKHGIKMLQAAGSNLTAVAVSTKEGLPITEAKDFTVTAFVPRKLSKKEMKTTNVESFEHVFAHAGHGLSAKRTDIDVVESGSAFRAMGQFSVPGALRGLYGGPPPILDSQKDFRSLRCGIGISNPVNEYAGSLSVGTLGFFIRESKNTYLVSNNHVIGKSSEKAGAKVVIGEAVVQPGTLDLSNIEMALLPTEAVLVKHLRIAEVAAVVPLQFMTAANIPVNRVDAAAAILVKSNRTEGDIDRLTYGGGITRIASYQVDPTNPTKILGESRVFKVGRTTGYTEGTVIALGGVTTIDYDGNSAYFAGQFVVKATPDNVGPFSNPGDSGSGVLNVRNELVGLLFAGSQQQTLVNPIDLVLAELAIELKVPAVSVATV